MAKRRSFSSEFKAKVALEAIKGQHTLAEIGSRFGVHPNVVGQWKKALVDHAADAFSDSRSKNQADEEELKARLYQQIGQLKVELDWLKKKTGLED
jgi:putative transposase